MSVPSFFGRDAVANGEIHPFVVYELFGGSVWWGCDYPERPHGEGEVWDHRCPKCVMRMKLVLATEGDSDLPEYDENGNLVGMLTLSGLIAEIEGGPG